jgi:Acyl-CoA dehydrogenase, C-terminal domain
VGGSGLGAAEEALIVVELGRRLVSPSILATIGAVHAGPIDAEPIGSGIRRTAAAYLRDNRMIVVNGAGADQILLRSDSGTKLIKADPSALHRIEDHLWLADLSELNGPFEVVADFDAAQTLRLKLIEGAALAGVAETALDMAVGYAALREQFGRPIGSQQAIKHHCADMAIAARSAQAQVGFAAMAVDQGRPDAVLQVESALLVAGSAAIGNAGTNIQIHGGIGFSDEADPHLALKRAQVILALAGGLEAATARIADIPVQN